jgi:DNA-binding MurR/RpiR family transcriptional regulator
MPGLDEAARPPGSLDELRARIAEIGEDLPKRLQQAAEYVLNNPEKIAVSTVAELSEEAGVAASAFMRFCQALGFSGFSSMQKLYRDAYTQRWPDYATRLERLREQGGGPAQLLGHFIEAGHQSLASLSDTVDLAALDRAVDLLSKAATIHVVGLRRSYPAASYLAYVFEKMEIPVMLHSGVGGVAHRHAIQSGDALIAVTFLPYSHETIELARHGAGRGIPVVGITDSAESPILEVSREVLTVREVDVGAFRPLAATLSLATTLAVAVGTAKNADASH